MTNFAQNPDKWSKETLKSLMAQAAVDPITHEQIVGGLLSSDFEEVARRKRENFKSRVLRVIDFNLPELEAIKSVQLAEEICKATIDESVVN